MAIGDIVNKFLNKFTDTIFYKKDSELEYQIEALKKVKESYPNNYAISKKLILAELGEKGEKEIEFELKNADIGMYVLHDINMQYKDIKAQIDYIIITPAKFYFVECKNLIGDIIVNSRGEFTREYNYGNKKIKEGFYSPVTQAQRHVDIFRKIWNERNKSIINRLQDKNFDSWCTYLVVMANPKNVLNLKYAPKEIKNKVIKSDRLVEYLKNEIQKTDKDLLKNQKEMHENAYGFMQNYNVEIERDYEQELIDWIEENKKKQRRKLYKTEINSPIKVVHVDVDAVIDTRKKLVEFRKEKSKVMGVPAYYIFTNDELDRILKLMPIDVEELRKEKILSSIKLKAHGEEIIRIINNNE